MPHCGFFFFFVAQEILIKKKRMQCVSSFKVFVATIFVHDGVI